MEEQTEGIVLRSQDYQERHRIVTLFTPQGLLSCIIRNISRKKPHLLELTTPFCHVEYQYKKKTHSELISFVDGSVVNTHLDLRQSLSMLQAAGALAHALLTSQMPGKPAPILFALYKSYHKQVVSFTQPEPLLASFYLKLLKHEGLLSISPHCSSCDNPAHRIYEGASFCVHHALNGTDFTPDQWEILLKLENAIQFSSLQNLSLSASLFEKIKKLFISYISH